MSPAMAPLGTLRNPSLPTRKSPEEQAINRGAMRLSGKRSLWLLVLA
jgi:hypothetical protein